MEEIDVLEQAEERWNKMSYVERCSYRAAPTVPPLWHRQQLGGAPEAFPATGCADEAAAPSSTSSYASTASL